MSRQPKNEESTAWAGPFFFGPFGGVEKGVEERSGSGGRGGQGGKREEWNTCHKLLGDTLLMAFAQRRVHPAGQDVGGGHGGLAPAIMGTRAAAKVREEDEGMEGEEFDGQVQARGLAAGVTSRRLREFRMWHGFLMVLHTIQAVIIMVLGNGESIGVTASWGEGPPGTRKVRVPQELFSVDAGGVIGATLLLAAVDHGLCVTLFRQMYETDVRTGICRLRWLEYASSATLQNVLMALYLGITDLSAILCMIGSSIGMISCGWAMENMNPPNRTETTYAPIVIGAFVGSFPWVSMWVYAIGGSSPSYMSTALTLQIVLFVLFPLNLLLSFLEFGPWKEYWFGERVFCIASLVVKSLLAWVMFGLLLV